MTDEKHDEPERTPLEAWGATWKAPASLREKTLDAARERGLIGGTPMRFDRRFLWGTAAAAALTFAIGFGLGNARTPAGRPVAVEEMSLPPSLHETRYMIFLFENDRYRSPATEAAMTERVQEYGGWAREIAAAGRSITGEKLSDDGRWCRVESGELQQAPPVSDPTRGALAGVFVIEAKSLEDAVSVARTCPHLKYGGSIEVRRIEET